MQEKSQTTNCPKCSSTSLYVDTYEDVLTCWQCGCVLYEDIIDMNKAMKEQDDRRYKIRKDSPIEKIKELLNKGKTPDEITEELKLTVNQMPYYIKKFKEEGLTWKQVNYIDKRTKAWRNRNK